MSFKNLPTPDKNALQARLAGKTEQALLLFHHFVQAFQQVGDIQLLPTKTMIGISNGERSVAWVTQFGRNFVHVVFPFAQPYSDNLCFQKIAQVPGDQQFNHHFRMYLPDDVNEEVMSFMSLAFRGA